MLQKLVAGMIIGIMFLVLMAVLSLIAAIPTYFLWNWLMPTIFGIKTVTFLQAWGINFLASILFKSSQSSNSNS